MACAPNLLLCFVSLSVRVALKLRSLRIHSPHLCRSAVFSVQTNVSLSPSLPVSPRGHSPSLPEVTCDHLIQTNGLKERERERRKESSGRESPPVLSPPPSVEPHRGWGPQPPCVPLGVRGPCRNQVRQHAQTCASCARTNVTRMHACIQYNTYIHT